MAKKKTTSKQKASAAFPEAGQLTLLRGIAGALLGGAWLLLAAALVSFDPADPPARGLGVVNHPPHNWIGKFGALLAADVYLMLGPGVWIAMAGVAVWLVRAAVGRPITQPLLRGLGVAIMTVGASAVLGLVGAHAAFAPVGLGPAPEGSGGLIAVYINDQLMARFAFLGTIVILGVGFWVGAVLTADRLVLALPRAIGEGLLRLTDIRLPRFHLPRPHLNFAGLGALLHRGHAEDDADAVAVRPSPSRKRRTRREREEDAYDEDAEEQTDEDETIDENVGGFAGTESFGLEDEVDYDDQDTSGDESGSGGGGGDAPSAYVSSKKRFDPDELREKMAKMPVNFAQKSKNAAPPPEVDLSGYQFPGLDLLEDPEGDFTQEQEKIVRDQAVKLESALREYKIEGEVVGIDSGPVITLFEVRLAPGTKASRISAVDTDIARALKAHNIRIVPNMAGKDTVGIEVPNIKKERVRLKELMSADRTVYDKMMLPMFLGKDASGNPLIQDLNAMPHMLIAGTTGSGKSVCMNSIIMSFLLTKRPDELKLVLVDPKMVEMSMFKSVPHLMCPVVTEMGKATAILEWAVTKMDERYELLAEAGVRDIASYNELGEEQLKERLEPSSDEEWARIPKKLPYMVFVIDELADLMMTNKEVEGSIVRVAQKARAVGIHLILATQRPQANVVTGLIKSNMPCRIAMKVSSGMDSRIVLDQKGGELLLGHGDMLFLSPRSSKLTRAQGCLVDDSEIRKTVRFLKNVAEQSFEPQLVQIKEENAELDEERDELFDDAVMTVMETGRGSVSLLQRKLTIGYGRASRMIEQMEAAGILGAHKTAQARQVLISPEEWEAMKEQAEADAAAEDAEGTLYEEDEAAENDAGEAEGQAVPAEMDDEYRQ